MVEEFVKRGYVIVLGGINNYSMLIDLCLKGVIGKDVENILVKVDIIVNKNMVLFDMELLFIILGICVGIFVIIICGIKEDEIVKIVDLIDCVFFDIYLEEIIDVV